MQLQLRTSASSSLMIRTTVFIIVFNMKVTHLNSLMQELKCKAEEARGNCKMRKERAAHAS